jgi:hypothetical protein
MNAYATSSRAAAIDPRMDTSIRQPQFGQMVETIEIAHKLLCELTERLSPVLTPVGPQAGDSIRMAAPSRSPIADQIERIGEIGQRVRELMDRIEV